MTEYWAQRHIKISEDAQKDADDVNAKMLDEYKRARKNVEDDIARFYGKYAVDNNISLADARKILDQKELTEFKWTLEEYTKKAISGDYLRQVENVSARVRLNRLEALQMQIDGHIDILKASQFSRTEELLFNAYEDSYYRNIFEIQRQNGYGYDFAILNSDKINKAINEPWKESNFSGRLWDDRTKLVNNIHLSLVQGFAQGDSIDDMSKRLTQQMGTSQNRCRIIVMTETAHIVESSTYQSYQETGVDKYQWLTLDLHACAECASLDQKVFHIKDYVEGATAPPIHPQDRCTTIPYFEDLDYGEGSYEVPYDTKYEDWKVEHLTD